MWESKCISAALSRGVGALQISIIMIIPFDQSTMSVWVKMYLSIPFDQSTMRVSQNVNRSRRHASPSWHCVSPERNVCYRYNYFSLLSYYYKQTPTKHSLLQLTLSTVTGLFYLLRVFLGFFLTIVLLLLLFCLCFLLTNVIYQWLTNWEVWAWVKGML